MAERNPLIEQMTEALQRQGGGGGANLSDMLTARLRSGYGVQPYREAITALPKERAAAQAASLESELGPVLKVQEAISRLKEMGLREDELEFRKEQLTAKAGSERSQSVLDAFKYYADQIEPTTARNLWKAYALDPATPEMNPSQASMHAYEVFSRALSEMPEGAVSPRIEKARAGVMVDEQGEQVGWPVVTKAGKVKMQRMSDGKVIDVPEGVHEQTVSGTQKGEMTAPQFQKLALEVHDDEESIRNLMKYMKSVEGSEQGWRLIGDQFVGALKTMFGGDITQEEFNTLRQTGQLNAMVGGFRVDVVGPGVMTALDALAVISALGGNVSMFRNPKVVAAAIRDMLEKKARRYDINRRMYNDQVMRTGRGAFDVKPKMDIDFSIFGGGISGDDPDKSDIDDLRGDLDG